MDSGARRSFGFFLHGHLPWVLPHGRWPHGAEWLCEAALATYLPLVGSLRRLREKGVAGGVTLGVSPVLAEQLAAPAFAEMFREYLEDRIRSSHDEGATFRRDGESRLAELAELWEERYGDARRFFSDELHGDLIAALRELQESGTLELATCAATHAYLPLLGRDESITAQLELARRVHERHFGRPPGGVWLPEAAYRPGGPWRGANAATDPRPRAGLEEFLARAALRYFTVDGSLLGRGTTGGSSSNRFRPDLRREARRPRESPPGRAAPLDVHSSYWIARRDPAEPNVQFFTRDPSTASQVWSGDHGYPGDPAYLEFHKKSDGGGHRYWRVSGPGVRLGDKDSYDPRAAAERVAAHADDFCRLVRDGLAGRSQGAILVAPYDAELFGHWWHEGVSWLEAVLERLHGERTVELTTLGEHASEFPPTETVALPAGSWGDGGHDWVWNNPAVAWTWQSIYPGEEETWNLWRDVRDSSRGEARRIAIAAVRQLMLGTASDWQFLITTESAVDYATERVRLHTDDLARLVSLGRRALDGHRLDPEEARFVRGVEERDRLFPELGDVLQQLRLETTPASDR